MWNVKFFEFILDSKGEELRIYQKLSLNAPLTYLISDGALYAALVT